MSKFGIIKPFLVNKLLWEKLDFVNKFGKNEYKEGTYIKGKIEDEAGVQFILDGEEKIGKGSYIVSKDVNIGDKVDGNVILSKEPIRLFNGDIDGYILYY